MSLDEFLGRNKAPAIVIDMNSILLKKVYRSLSHRLVTLILSHKETSGFENESERRT